MLLNISNGIVFIYHVKMTFLDILWAHKLWARWARYVLSTMGALILLLWAHKLKQKCIFVAYLQWIPTSISISRYFREHSKIFSLGTVIYNCLLQQVSHFEFGFEFELVPLCGHNHLVTKVMHVSLNRHNVTWVNLGWIDFSIYIELILEAWCHW